MSPATIYQYFKNKEEFYISLNLNILEYLIEDMGKAYNNNALSVEEKITKFKEAMWNLFQNEL